jgi:Phosphotransferase enzyme family
VDETAADAPSPNLAVVISDFGGDCAGSVASVLAAGEHAGARVKVIVVSPRASSMTVPDGVRKLEVFPLGAAYTRNRGLADTSARVVAFLDGGLVVAEEWVEALLETLGSDSSPDAVVGAISGSGLRDGRARVLGRLRLELLPPSWVTGGVSNAGFRRSKLLALGGFEHALNERRGSSILDAEVFIRWTRRRGRLAWMPSMLASRPALDDMVETDIGGDIAQWARRQRSPALALRYLADSRGSGERLRAVRELVAGAVREPNLLDASALLRLLPESLKNEFRGTPEPFARSARAKTHFLYRAGGDRVLHLYVNPSDRFRRSLAEREAIRLRSAVAGIPRVCAVAEAIDAIWVVEELVPGDAPDIRAPERWFPRVADWAVGMAGPRAKLLREVPTWREHCEQVLASAPAELSGRVRAALEVVSQLPAVHMHGDLQRRNVLIDGERVGAVDWEGAWLEGLPGLDVVFLALFAGSDSPEERILARLARGEDAPWGGVRATLARLGLDEDSVLRAALVAMLGTWAVAEDRRLARLGAPPGRPVFRPLFHRLAAE